MYDFCRKLTAGLRHDLRLPKRFKTCFKMLRHFSDVHTNRKSCRRQKSDRVNRPLVACLLNESDAGGDLVLIETSLLFLC